MHTREAELIQDIHMYKDFQDWPTVAAHRVRYGRVQKVYLQVRNPERHSQRPGAHYGVLSESLLGD